MLKIHNERYWKNLYDLCQNKQLVVILLVSKWLCTLTLRNEAIFVADTIVFYEMVNIYSLKLRIGLHNESFSILHTAMEAFGF